MKITLDQLFKLFGLRYFTAKDCEVRPEDELYAAPKRIDLLVVKKEPNESWNKLGILDYFLEYNLISYKSFRDNVSLKDLWDCFIYYYACLINRDYHLLEVSSRLALRKVAEKIKNPYR